MVLMPVASESLTGTAGAIDRKSQCVAASCVLGCLLGAGFALPGLEEYVNSGLLVLSHITVA